MRWKKKDGIAGKRYGSIFENEFDGSICRSGRYSCMGVVADDHRIDIRIYGKQGNPPWRDYLALCNIALWFVKSKMFQIGYTSGTKLITNLGKRLTVFTEAASIMGLSVVGALIATSVKITTALNFKVGEVALNLQTDIFWTRSCRLFFLSC